MALQVPQRAQLPKAGAFCEGLRGRPISSCRTSLAAWPPWLARVEWILASKVQRAMEVSVLGRFWGDRWVRAKELGQVRRPET